MTQQLDQHICSTAVYSIILFIFYAYIKATI